MDWFLSHETLLGVAASMLGVGIKFRWLCEKLAALLAWLATAQGQVAIKDLDAALDVVFQSLQDAGHPAPQDVIVAIQSTIAEAQAAALKTAPTVPMASAPATAPAVSPGAPLEPATAPAVSPAVSVNPTRLPLRYTPSGRLLGMATILLGLLALGAGLSATTFDLSVGSPVGSSMWQFGQGGTLVSEGSTVAGLGLVGSYGVMEVSGTAAVYQPYVAVMAGVGGETKDASNYADAFVGIGPVIPGLNIPCFAAANFRCGAGQPPCIMLCTSISYNLSLWRSR